LNKGPPLYWGGKKGSLRPSSLGAREHDKEEGNTSMEEEKRMLQSARICPGKVRSEIFGGKTVRTIKGRCHHSRNKIPWRCGKRGKKEVTQRKTRKSSAAYSMWEGKWCATRYNPRKEKGTPHIKSSDGKGIAISTSKMKGKKGGSVSLHPQLENQQIGIA